MTVNKVYLDGFRNYRDETVRFGDGINVVSGSNAQGKTNLIEAVYYLTCGHSFRPAGDKELIAHDRDGACIRADIESGGREQTIEAKLFHGRRRELYANGVKLKNATEMTARFSAVMFGPDDLNMIKEGAVVRRKLMDQCLSQLRPGYIAALTEFNRLYEHKTRILRDFREKPALLELLDDFDFRLAQQSAKLIYYRTAFAAALSVRAANICSDFTRGTDTLLIRYKTVGGMDPAGRKPEQILPELIEHQRAHRQAELNAGLCLSGAHKDDLEIYINSVPTRKFASQGQARTVAVSIKLAERDIYYEDRGEYPVLLLDDVLSELDSNRQEFILGRIKCGQVIITCCDENIAATAPGNMILRVEKGRIRK